VISARPDFWEGWYERGLVLEELGLYAAAAGSYEQALALAPAVEACGEIYFHQAQVQQYGLGDYEAALIAYDRALTRSPQHGMALFHRGNALLYGLHQPEAAIASYDRAISQQPEWHEVWCNRGHALVELGQHGAALASYDRALAINPKDEGAQQGRQLALNAATLHQNQEPTTQVAAFDSEAFDASLADPSLMESSPPLSAPAVSSRGSRLVDYAAPTAKIPTAQVPTAQVPTTQTLLVIEDQQGRREVNLSQRQHTIGRDPRNDIHLASQFVSRFHAVLQRVDLPDRSDYHYQIKDGDLAGKPSKNGIQINGQPHQIRQLQAGDVVVFGPDCRGTFQRR
jgi:tetratricopeptide (TPR) repeat protein